MINYIRQAWLVLLLGLVFGTALAGVNSWLAPIITVNERKAREVAALAVIDSSVRAEAVEVALADGSSVTVFRVLGANDALAGWAVPVQGQGYGDTIKLIVGVTADAATITDFRVIYNQETPGLGNKIIGEEFRGRFAGKAAAIQLAAVNRDNVADNEIQALTGATISSQAVCDIIYRQLSDSGLLKKLAAYPGNPSAAPTEN